MARSSEIRTILRFAKDNGCTIEKCRDGHMVYLSDRRIATIHTTPSGGALRAAKGDITRALKRAHA